MTPRGRGTRPPSRGSTDDEVSLSIGRGPDGQDAAAREHLHDIEGSFSLGRVGQGDGLHRAVVLQPSQRARFGRHHELVVSRPSHRRQSGIARDGGGGSARAGNALQVALLQKCEVLAVRREHRAATVLGAGQRHRRELIERPYVHLRYAARTLGGVGEEIAAGRDGGEGIHQRELLLGRQRDPEAGRRYRRRRGATEDVGPGANERQRQD